MVSSMESFYDPRQDLADVERAAAAPYVDYPPTPRWYPASVGLWSTALVAADGWLRHDTALFLAAIVVLFATNIAFITWYRRLRGTMPSMRHAPAEIAREMAWFIVGCVVVVALVALAFVTIGTLAACVVTFVLVTSGVAWYERRYARAAGAVRARLA